MKIEGVKPKTMDIIAQTKKALEKGQVCLLPTDTLPGLSFDPKNKMAQTCLGTIC